MRRVCCCGLNVYKRDQSRSWPVTVQYHLWCQKYLMTSVKRCWRVEKTSNFYQCHPRYSLFYLNLIERCGWGCEVSCGGHHRLRGKTTMGSALDGAVFDIAQILAYLVHNMSRSQLYLGFGHFGWLPSFFGQWHFGGLMVKLYFLCWNYSLSSGWHIIAA